MNSFIKFPTGPNPNMTIPPNQIDISITGSKFENINMCGAIVANSETITLIDPTKTVLTKPQQSAFQFAIYYNYIAFLDYAKAEYFNSFFNLTMLPSFNYTDPKNMSYFKNNTQEGIPVSRIRISDSHFINFNALKNFTQEKGFSLGRTTQGSV